MYSSIARACVLSCSLSHSISFHIASIKCIEFTNGVYYDSFSHFVYHIDVCNSTIAHTDIRSYICVKEYDE